MQQRRRLLLVWHLDAARGPSTPSFDHLVGAQQERFGDRQTKRVRSGQIDDEIEFVRLLDRDIGRLGSAQEPQRSTEYLPYYPP
jgi:hypothetical protein